MADAFDDVTIEPDTTDSGDDTDTTDFDREALAGGLEAGQEATGSDTTEESTDEPTGDDTGAQTTTTDPLSREQLREARDTTDGDTTDEPTQDTREPTQEDFGGPLEGDPGQTETEAAEEDVTDVSQDVADTAPPGTGETDTTIGTDVETSAEQVTDAAPTTDTTTQTPDQQVREEITGITDGATDEPTPDPTQRYGPTIPDTVPSPGQRVTTGPDTAGPVVPDRDTEQDLGGVARREAVQMDKRQAAGNLERQLLDLGIVRDIGAEDVRKTERGYVLQEDIASEAGQEYAERQAATKVAGVSAEQEQRIGRLDALSEFRDVQRGLQLEQAKRSGVDKLEKSLFGPLSGLADLDQTDVTFQQSGEGTLQVGPSDELERDLEESYEESLVRGLEEETGTELTREDIAVEETEEGYRARLSESGKRKVEIEQTPGEDIPVIGGIMTTGTRARMGIREVTDPFAERWREVTPSKEDVYGIAAAGAPIAVAEPTPAGEVAIGAIVGTGLTAAALQKRGNVLTGDDPQATTTQTKAPTANTVQIGIGGPFVEEELEPGEPVQDVTELEEGSTTRVSELTAEESPTEQTQVPVPDGSIFRDELQVPDTPTGNEPVPVVGTQPVTTGALEKQKQEEEEETLGVPDDPFLESDRRLYDPQRDFGEREDVTESVDPTSETFESEEDIGEGIAGQGQGLEPARGVDTIQENWEQYIKEKEQREVTQEPQRPAGIGEETGLTQAGVTQGARERAQEAKEMLQETTQGIEPGEETATEPGFDVSQTPDVGTGVAPEIDQEVGQEESQTPTTDTTPDQVPAQTGQLDDPLDATTEQTQFGEEITQAQPQGLIDETVPAQTTTPVDVTTTPVTEYPAETTYGYGYGTPGVPTDTPRVPTTLPTLPENGDDGDEEYRTLGQRSAYGFDFIDPLSGERLETDVDDN